MWVSSSYTQMSKCLNKYEPHSADRYLLHRKPGQRIMSDFKVHRVQRTRDGEMNKGRRNLQAANVGTINMESPLQARACFLLQSHF